MLHMAPLAQRSERLRGWEAYAGSEETLSPSSFLVIPGTHCLSLTELRIALLCMITDAITDARVVV